MVLKTEVEDDNVRTFRYFSKKSLNGSPYSKPFSISPLPFFSLYLSLSPNPLTGREKRPETEHSFQWLPHRRINNLNPKPLTHLLRTRPLPETTLLLSIHRPHWGTLLLKAMGGTLRQWGTLQLHIQGTHRLQGITLLTMRTTLRLPRRRITITPKITERGR